jgi:hypothetical protein
MQEKYWASKVPISLTLLFLVNVFLIIALELLFVYQYPTAVDEAVLGKYNPTWSGSSVISRDESSSLNAYLIGTPETETQLLVVKKHSVFFGRGKAIYSAPVEMPESGEVTVSVRNGLHTSQIVIKDIPTGVWSVSILYSYSGGIREATSYYMILAATLEALELMVLHFIKKNLQ